MRRFCGFFRKLLTRRSVAKAVAASAAASRAMLDPGLSHFRSAEPSRPAPPASGAALASLALATSEIDGASGRGNRALPRLTELVGKLLHQRWRDLPSAPLNPELQRRLADGGRWGRPAGLPLSADAQMGPSSLMSSSTPSPKSAVCFSEHRVRTAKADIRTLSVKESRLVNPETIGQCVD